MKTTKDKILEVGLDLWSFDPGSVSARRIGKRLGLTHAAVLYHFGSSGALKDALAAHAVALKDAVIVPMLIAAKHPSVSVLSADERARYLRDC